MTYRSIPFLDNGDPLDDTDMGLIKIRIYPVCSLGYARITEAELAEETSQYWKPDAHIQHEQKMGMHGVGCVMCISLKCEF
jgi:hypothetical protein